MPKTRRRKLKRRTGAGARFRQGTGPRPLPPGYERKSETRMQGAADSFQDLMLQVGAKVVEMAMLEIQDQASGDFRRPFNAYADQRFDEGSTVSLTIKGARPGDKEFVEITSRIDPDAYHETTRENVAELLLEKIAEIAVEATDEMNYQNETLDVSAFALGCFIRLTDTLHLLHLRLECLPPSPLEGFVMNSPEEG